jgi:hypothetical protein
MSIPLQKSAMNALRRHYERFASVCSNRDGIPFDTPPDADFFSAPL